MGKKRQRFLLMGDAPIFLDVLAIVAEYRLRLGIG
jgi:hypothetical protein